MRRKIAFFFAIAMTVLLAVLRSISATSPHLPLSDSLWILALVAIVGVMLLCFSRRSVSHPIVAPHATLCGWLASFCGAVMSISVLLDIFCWVVYQQVPPPNTVILNNIDYYCLILSIIFGLCGGSYLIIQGFRWMAGEYTSVAATKWLSLGPVLWMWFRLARYEISYASTIDIQESFFDFAVLVFGALFFLQFARTVTKIGPAPKSGSLIFSLCTAMVALSGLPLAFIELANGANISTVLIGIVDAAVGVFALSFALSQVFPAKQKEPPVAKTPSDSNQPVYAWTDPAKTAVFEPPFNIERPLPKTATVVTAEPTNGDNADDTDTTDHTVAPVNIAASATLAASDDSDISIDDLISEIESEQDSV